MPIDRVFSIAGFGTVVTGTLTGGHLDIGDTVAIVPGDRAARIRGLQSHKIKLQRATPGMRVAANLTGVTVDDLSRGQVITAPGTLAPTTLVDVYLQVVRDVPWPVRHSMPVEFFTGAASSGGRIRLLERDELEAGEEGWAQVQLFDPIAATRRDRFVVRMPSPSVTLGGGEIVDAHPVRRHRRNDAAVVRRLKALYEGDAAGTLLALLNQGTPLSAAEVVRRSQLEEEAAESAFRDLLASGEVLALSDRPEGQPLARWTGLLMTRRDWDSVLERASLLLEQFHAAQPLRAGMSREEFRSRLGLVGEWGNGLIERAQAEGRLVPVGDVIALPSHRVQLSTEQEKKIDRLMDLFHAAPYTPPGWSEVEAAVGTDLAQYLVESGRLVRLGDAVVFEADVIEDMVARLRQTVGTGGTFTVAQVRDIFGTSRKYIVAFLEELDRRRITRRLGDERVLR